METIEAARVAQVGADRLRAERPVGRWDLSVAGAGGRHARGSVARRRVRRILRRSRSGDVVVLGEEEDPYAREEGVREGTRECLEALRDGVGLSLCILTRSPGILEDLDLIHAFPRAAVGIVVPSVGPRLVRRLEPGLPDPRARLSLLRRLVREGVSAGLELRPVFPGLGDRLGTLRRVAEAAADAGAEWFRVMGLRLAGDGRILDVVGRRYPGLARMYALRFGPEGEPPRIWESRLQSMAASLRMEAGLADRPFAFQAAGDRLVQLRLPLSGFGSAPGGGAL